MSITRRLFLRNSAAAGATAVSIAVPVAVEAAATPVEPMTTLRDRALWHMRQLESLAKEDGAREAMIVVTGRFYTPEFHTQTLMLTHTGVDDFGDGMFLSSNGKMS